MRYLRHVEQGGFNCLRVPRFFHDVMGRPFLNFCPFLFASPVACPEKPKNKEHLLSYRYSYPSSSAARAAVIVSPPRARPACLAPPCVLAQRHRCATARRLCASVSSTHDKTNRAASSVSKRAVLFNTTHRPPSRRQDAWATHVCAGGAGAGLRRHCRGWIRGTNSRCAIVTREGARTSALQQSLGKPHLTQQRLC